MEEVWEANKENIKKDAQKREAVAPLAAPKPDKASAEGEKKNGKGPEATQEKDRNEYGNMDECLLGLTFEREPKLKKENYYPFMDYINPAAAKVEAEGEPKENGNPKDKEKKEEEEKDVKGSPKKDKEKKEKDEEKKEKDEPKRTGAGKENDDDENNQNDNMEPVEDLKGKDGKKKQKCIIANGALVANSKAEVKEKKSEDSFPLCPVDRRENAIKKKLKAYSTELKAEKEKVDEAVKNTDVYKKYMDELKNLGDAEFENIMVIYYCI